jgi:hypothetical protein
MTDDGTRNNWTPTCKVDVEVETTGFPVTRPKLTPKTATVAASFIEVVPFQYIRKPVFRVKRGDRTFCRVFGPVLITPTNTDDECPVTAALNTHAMGTIKIVKPGITTSFVLPILPLHHLLNRESVSL